MVTWCPTKNLGPIGSAVLTFIGYKQTDKQRDKPSLYIEVRKKYFPLPFPHFFNVFYRLTNICRKFVSRISCIAGHPVLLSWKFKKNFFNILPRGQILLVGRSTLHKHCTFHLNTPSIRTNIWIFTIDPCFEMISLFFKWKITV